MTIALSAPAGATSICIVTTSGVDGVLTFCDGELKSRYPMQGNWLDNYTNSTVKLRELISAGYRVVGTAMGSTIVWTLQKD